MADPITSLGSLASAASAAQFNAARVDTTNSIRRQQVDEQQQTTVQASGGASTGSNLSSGLGGKVDIRV